jgi:hypothetical protein
MESSDLKARYDDCCQRLNVLSPSTLQPPVASSLGEALRSRESVRLAGLQCIAACGRGEARRAAASTRKLIAAVPSAEDFLKQPRQAAAAVAACWPDSGRIERLASWEAPLGGEIQALASVLHSRGDASQATRGSSSDALVWALSRYSPTERLPYRRLADRPMQLLSLVARDAAEVSGALDDEELASIAVNIVAAAGVDIAERQSVLHWLGLVCSAPQFGGAERAAPISEPLLRAEGAPEPEWTGLPISLGWHRVTNKGRIDADDLRELCAVDPDAVIDLGDLLTWMVREQVIGKRLQAEAKL